jgi:hypothetical protein
VRNLGQAVNSGIHELAPYQSFDGSTLLFSRSDFAAIPADFFIARRAPGALTFSTATPMRPPVNSPDWDSGIGLAGEWPSSGARIYFGSYRPGGPGRGDIWEATWTVVLEALQCNVADCGGVTLRWSNPNDLVYEAVSVRRDGRKIADLDPGVLDYTDGAAEPGPHVYTVGVRYNGAGYSQRCEVDAFCAGPRFLRAECNGDGKVDIADAVCALEWLFLGRDDPGCRAALDTNGDAATDLSDPVWLLGFLFLGSGPPVAPFPTCGKGTLASDGDLGCDVSTPGCS